MTDSAINSPKRLLRVLIGGAILAAAWVGIDLITHADGASAAEFPDVTASGSNPAPDVVAPVIEHLTAIAAQVSHETASPVVEAEAAVEQAVSVILAAPAAVIAPVIAPVVDVLAAPLAPVVGGVVGALPALPQLAVLPSAAALLSSGGNGVALAASNVPLLPTPVGGIPRDLPAVPTPPAGDQSAGTAFAVLGSAALAPPGTALTARAAAGGIPSSPTYGFDTTPD